MKRLNIKEKLKGVPKASLKTPVWRHIAIWDYVECFLRIKVASEVKESVRQQVENIENLIKYET